MWYFSFRTLSRKIEDLSQKTLSEFVESASFVSKKNILGEVFEKKHNFFFSHFDWKVSAILKKMFSQKTFGVFGKQFRRVVLTAFYMSKRKFWGRDLVSNSYIFMTVFGFWTSCSALSVKNFLAGFSKLLFKCPKEHFAKWSIFFRKKKFRLFSDMRRNSPGQLATNFWQGLQICGLRVQRNIW